MVQTRDNTPMRIRTGRKGAAQRVSQTIATTAAARNYRTGLGQYTFAMSDELCNRLPAWHVTNQEHGPTRDDTQTRNSFLGAVSGRFHDDDVLQVVLVVPSS